MLERQVWCRQWLLRHNEGGHATFVALVEAVPPFTKKQETCVTEPIHSSQTVALAITAVSHEGACPSGIYQGHVPGTFSYVFSSRNPFPDSCRRYTSQLHDL